MAAPATRRSTQRTVGRDARRTGTPRAAGTAPLPAGVSRSGCGRSPEQWSQRGTPPADRRRRATPLLSFGPAGLTDRADLNDAPDQPTAFRAIAFGLGRAASVAGGPIVSAPTAGHATQVCPNPSGSPSPGRRPRVPAGRRQGSRERSSAIALARRSANV